MNTNIREKVKEQEWKELCEKHLFQKTALGEVLQEIEFFEGGFAWVENGEFWISGDNGRTSFDIKLITSVAIDPVFMAGRYNAAKADLKRLWKSKKETVGFNKSTWANNAEFETLSFAQTMKNNFFDHLEIHLVYLAILSSFSYETMVLSSYKLKEN